MGGMEGGREGAPLVACGSYHASRGVESEELEGMRGHFLLHADLAAYSPRAFPCLCVQGSEAPWAWSFVVGRIQAVPPIFTPRSWSSSTGVFQPVGGYRTFVLSCFLRQSFCIWVCRIPMRVCLR